MIRPDYQAVYNSRTQLYHYGIPRRSGRYPWGSGKKPYQDALKGRRRSEYFTSERTLPKGTKVYRTATTNSKTIGGRKPTYVSYLDPDRDLYKSGHIRVRDKADKAYEYEMTLKEDLKIPSRSTFIDTVDNVIKKNPKLFKESIEGFFKVIMPEGSSRRADIEFDPMTGKFDTKRFDKYVKESYTYGKNIPVKEQWGTIAMSFGQSDNLKKAVINELKSKGYNAMVDEASVGGLKRSAGGSSATVEGIDPLILFDSSILKVDNISEIGSKEEKDSAKKYLKWRNTATNSAYYGAWSSKWN